MQLRLEGRLTFGDYTINPSGTGFVILEKDVEIAEAGNLNQAIDYVADHCKLKARRANIAAKADQVYDFIKEIYESSSTFGMEQRAGDLLRELDTL